jgi:hypothetical protein
MKELDQLDDLVALILIAKTDERKEVRNMALDHIATTLFCEALIEGFSDYEEYPE